MKQRNKVGNKAPDADAKPCSPLIKNMASEFKSFSVLDAAKEYTKWGWIVHPVHPWNDPKVNERARGKAPCIEGWQKRDAPPTEEEIQYWFRDTAFNIGLQCGKRSGVTVIDYDHELFWPLLTDGIPLNTLESYRTEGRGHVFFRYEPLKSKKYHVLGLEVLNDGINAILPPSRHKEGQTYQWRDPDAPLAPMPEKLKQRLQKLIASYEKLMAALAKVRPCFNRLWNNGNPQPLHGGEGRECMAAWMLELREYGADLEAIKILARLVYKEKYDQAITTREWQYWTGKPWTCKKIKEKLGSIITCKECSFAERKTKESGKNAKKKEKQPSITVEEIESMEDFNGANIIANHVIYKKLYEGVERRFFVKVYCGEDGEIKKEVDPAAHSIPEQTAPSVNFYETEYGSLKECFNELLKLHTEYVAFPANSIYPTLMALGSMASYFREAFYTYPYFEFISSEPETGKTTAMKTQTFTSFYGTIASSVSEAVLFREIDKSHCFYGLDNIERLFQNPKEYAAILDWLLSSYSRDIPCRRVANVDDRFEVVSFDGYGEKAFTHITDFPPFLSTLKSRCIQIVMQKGQPRKSYPTPEKFTTIRDKLYHARLREFQKVKETYEELIRSGVLTGRTGDLFYPLLVFAKFVSHDLYEWVLRHARETEKERIEPNPWNVELIRFIINEGHYGSISPKDIRGGFEEELHLAGLLKEDKTITTRKLTSMFKKLGFARENKKTDNKSWFIVDQDTVFQRAYEYGIRDQPPESSSDEVRYPPPSQKPNFTNFVNSREEGVIPEKERTEEQKEQEEVRMENREAEFHGGEEAQQLEKIKKINKTEGATSEKVDQEKATRRVDIKELSSNGELPSEVEEGDRKKSFEKKPYKCHFCEESFTTSHGVVKHTREVHLIWCEEDDRELDETEKEREVERTEDTKKVSGLHQLGSIEEDECAICGEKKFLDHALTDGSAKKLLCPTCAEKKIRG